MSIVEKLEDDMSKRSNRFLTFLGCVAIVGNFGCTTTTHRVGPSPAAMEDYEIGRNTATINWYVNKEARQIDPNKKSRLCTVYRNVAPVIANPAMIGYVITRRLATMKSSRSKSD